MKLTQVDLSEKAGVGLKVVRDIEQGKKTNFQTGPILKILNLLGPVKIGIVS
jgi:hypothetical protein